MSQRHWTLPCLALVAGMAMTAPAFARNLIVVDGPIKAKDVKCRGCVDARDIGDNAVNSREIQNGAVTNPKIGIGAVTSPSIADGAVTGADMNADISLGTASNDGDLSVKNTAGAATLSLDGATGNATNLFANAEGSSNGLVKAWAKIAADGSVVACWLCNRDPNFTRNVNPGSYTVDFTPLSTDISGRPRLAVLDEHINLFTSDGQAISLAGTAEDLSSIFVDIRDATGEDLNDSFTVIIY